MWRGTSPLVTLSSMVAGRSASGVMPTCSSRAKRRGEAEASTSFGLRLDGVARVRGTRGSAAPAVKPAADLARGGSGFAGRSALTRPARSDLSLFKAISDPSFSEIIRRHLDQNLVARKHPDAVLAHSPRRMGDDLVFVLELHPERGIGEQFRHHPRKFEHLFLRHKAPSQSKFAGEWSRKRTKSRPIADLGALTCFSCNRTKRATRRLGCTPNE